MNKKITNNQELKKPYFSIIIPAYNVEKHIEKSVKSVLNNSFLNFEIIIVDDGSSDGTKLVCDELISNDDRVVYISQKNSGPNVARNNAIAHSKGEYIIFLDADDELSENAMNILSSELNSEYFDFINFGISFINDKTKKITNKISHNRAILKNNEIINAAMRGEGILSVCWSKVINREFLIKNNIKFIPDKIHGRDIIFSRLLSLKSKRTLIISDILIRSYELDNSFSRTFSINNIKSAIHVAQDHVEIFSNEDIDKSILNYAIYRHLRYISVVSSFRFDKFSLYCTSIDLLKESFADITKFKNCNKLKDFLFVLWLKFPAISFLVASILNKLNIRPY